MKITITDSLALEPVQTTTYTHQLKYVKGFDTVRAFAVLLVIISHWGPFFRRGTVPNVIMTQVIPSGQFGVTLFFVLSGYLITSILLNERRKCELEGGKKSTVLTSFFVRRSLRIFPIYYLTLLVLYIVQQPWLREHLGYYVCYLGNILPYRENRVNPLVHTWSLAVEEQFYIIWPWIILYVRERYMKFVFITAIVIGIFSKYIVMFPLHHDFAVLVVNWLDAFGVGGLYAWMRMDSSRYPKFDKGMVTTMVLLLYVGWRIMPISGLPVGMMFTRRLDIPVSLGIIIFVLNNRSETLRRYLLENPVLNFLGKISYGLYLYHYILEPYVTEWLKGWLQHGGIPQPLHEPWFAYLVNYTVLILLCWCSYTFIEKPILSLKDKFKYT